MVAAYGSLTAEVSWLDLRVGSHLVVCLTVCVYHINWGNFCKSYSYVDSTIGADASFLCAKYIHVDAK